MWLIKQNKCVSCIQYMCATVISSMVKKIKHWINVFKSSLSCQEKKTVEEWIINDFVQVSISKFIKIDITERTSKAIF